MSVLKPAHSQLTILLSDPDMDVMDRNASLLQEMGLFQHLCAETGSETLAMVKNFDPDLMILSQDLPDISGLSILNIIRQNHNVRTKSIILLVKDPLTERFIAKAGHAGADAYLQVPYDNETFKAKVHRTIHRETDPRIEKAEELNERCSELIESGKLDEALETCNAIIDLSDNAEVYYNRGYILSVRKMFEEALSSFKKATLINNQHARAFMQMGLVYKMMGRTDEAQSCLERAAELHVVLDQENEAEEIINIVLTLRPNTTNVYNTLGIIYRHQGRLRESVGAYEKARKVHPNDENILFNLARVHIDMNNIPKAQECLRSAVLLNKSFGPAMDLLRATELGLKLKT
ncbi:MAG: tetratricopeptide repeat protein [Deltaproteobacteria bacterium]|jgi:tetratricopeptide (TPR) repeat protein|nr:tetratricopeptide repeat protein [Deltaproteobacteria bacterium]